MGIMRRRGNLWRRGKVDEEIDMELRSHVEMRTEDNVAAGMSPQQARRDARLRFGNLVVMKERAMAANVALGIDGVWREVRFALRQLRKSPGFTATAVITLALGIGANAIVFSVLNALVLRPLNVNEPGRLFVVEHKEHASYMQSYPDYIDYRDDNSTFSGMAAYDTTDVAIMIGNTACTLGSKPLIRTSSSTNNRSVPGHSAWCGRSISLKPSHSLSSTRSFALESLVDAGASELPLILA
jgi:hypothetical protein